MLESGGGLMRGLLAVGPPYFSKASFDLVEVAAGDASALAGQADVLKFLNQASIPSGL